MSNYPLIDSDNVVCAVNVADKAGNPVSGVSLDAGTLTASPSDASAVSATVSADQATVTLVALGVLATDVTVVLAAASGGSPLSGTFVLDVVAGPAATITLVPGTPAAN